MTKTHLFFNEIDRYAAQWLRNLFPDVVVDERSIVDVQARDVVGYDRCHFFGGIGGWEYALQLAGWPNEWSVWTGSCPCQPFSGAGKAEALGDERHLWPAFRRLIAECRPAVVFGEQIASHLGRAWLAGIRVDLEALGYAVGAADLCAASVGAPHIRQRLFWVAHAKGERLEGRRNGSEGLATGSGGLLSTRPGEPCQMANAMPTGRTQGRTQSGDGQTAGSGSTVGMADMQQSGREGAIRQGMPRARRQDVLSAYHSNLRAWGDSEFIPCLDGKARRTQPGIRPLAHGVSARAPKLRAYGNAIVPPLTAVFIRAFLEVEHDV